MRERSIKFNFYLNEKEDKKLKRNMQKLGLSQSEYFRNVILTYEPPLLPDKKLIAEIVEELKVIGKIFNNIARQFNSLNYINVDYYKVACDRLENVMDKIRVVFFEN